MDLQKLRERLMSGYKRLLGQASVTGDAEMYNSSAASAGSTAPIAQPHIQLLGAALSHDPLQVGSQIDPTTQLDANQQAIL